MLEFSYRLQFRSPVSVFTGLGIAGLVDRTVVRDTDGLPYIPGSTVKGRLRFFAERILRVRTPENRLYSLHDENKPQCKTPADACTLCRLFGNAALPAVLSVGQASLETTVANHRRKQLEADLNPVFRAGVDIRPGIALSRQRRTALTDHLFFDEAIPLSTFIGALRLDYRDVKDKEKEDTDFCFLKGIGRLVDALGGRKAVGRGRLEGGIQIGMNYHH